MNEFRVELQDIKPSTSSSINEFKCLTSSTASRPQNFKLETPLHSKSLLQSLALTNGNKHVGEVKRFDASELISPFQVQNYELS